MMRRWENFHRLKRVGEEQIAGKSLKRDGKNPRLIMIRQRKFILKLFYCGLRGSYSPRMHR